MSNYIYSFFFERPREKNNVHFELHVNSLRAAACDVFKKLLLNVHVFSDEHRSVRNGKKKIMKNERIFPVCIVPERVMYGHKGEPRNNGYYMRREYNIDLLNEIFLLVNVTLFYRLFTVFADPPSSAHTMHCLLMYVCTTSH